MAEQPTDIKANKDNENKTIQNKDSLLEKLFPSLAVISISAIFYFTGWVYIAHWYSYYGLDATRINLPIQIILLHGFPGILVLGASGLLAILGVALSKRDSSRPPLEFEDAPNVIIIAYIICLAAILVIVAYLKLFMTNAAIDIPAEVSISFSGFFLVIFILQNRTVIKKVVNRIIGQKRAEVLVEFLQSNFPDYQNRLADLLQETTANEEFHKTMDEYWAKSSQALQYSSLAVFGTFDRVWRIWISVILLFYFLISVSFSALLGEWDAARGARFLIGNWHLPEVVLFSKASLPVLQGKEKVLANNSYEYSELGLLASDDKAYYLVDWKTTDFYTHKPGVYIIPQSGDLTLKIIISLNSPQVPAVAPTPINTSTP